MARILTLFCFLSLLALPVLADNADTSGPGMSLGSPSGMQMKLTANPKAKAKSAPVKLTLSVENYEATPVPAAEIQEVLAQLQGDDEETSAKAGVRLALTGDSVVSPLATMLTAGDKVRRRAAIVLLAIGTPKALQALQKASRPAFLADLNGEDSAAPFIAVLVLASIGDQHVIERLTVILQEKDVNEGWRLPVLFGLVFNPSVKVWPFVEECLVDPNPEVRAFAVLFIIPFAGGKAFDQLVAMLGDSNEMVRTMTMGALGSLDDKRAISILSHAILFDESAGVRVFAAMKFSDLHDAQSIPLLLRALSKEEDAKVKVTLLVALGHQSRTPEIQAALEAACTDADAQVREAAESALTTDEKK